MAEIPGAPHSEECATATGTICVCSCRGALHGSMHRGGVPPVLRRMAEITVGTGRHPDHIGADITNAPDARVATPAERRRHPVTVVETDAPPGVPVGPEVTHTSTRIPSDLTAVSDEDLMAHFADAAEGGSDYDAQRVWDEMGRRETAAAPKPYVLPGPVHTMTDDDLATAAHDASGEHLNEAALQQIYDEMERREVEANRRADAVKTAPTAPAAVRMPAYQMQRLRGEGKMVESRTGDSAQADRVKRAERLALGLDQDAPDDEFLAASSADPRTGDERAEWELAWYRQIATAEGVPWYDDNKFGPQDDPKIVAERETAAALKEVADKRAAAIEQGPAGPARLANPISAWGVLINHADSYRRETIGARALDRIQQAQRRVLDLPPGADEKAIKAAERADQRGPVELAGEYMSWYRLLTSHADLGELRYYDDWVHGQADQAGAVTRPRLMPANVAKPWDVWQDIQKQAKDDRKAGNEATFNRYVMAMRHAYGLSDHEDAGEISKAHKADQRTQHQQAADFISAYRQLADAEGVDPSDTLRHGPPDRGAGKNKPPTQWREATPEQDKQLDALLAKGWGYVDAYAEVHHLDATQLHREQAESAVDKQTRESIDKAVRRQYDEHLHLQYVQAETDVRGHMLNAAGKAAGIDPVTLFSGPNTRARKYASEDLLRWWAEPGQSRMTAVQFRAQVLGKDTDREKARVAAMAAQGKDFG